MASRGMGFVYYYSYCPSCVWDFFGGGILLVVILGAVYHLERLVLERADLGIGGLAGRGFEKIWIGLGWISTTEGHKGCKA